MKFIITEEQDDLLKFHDKVQKMFFKFWDKNGPKIDEDTLKLFGFERGTAMIGSSPINVYNVRRFLREWYGETKALMMAKEMLDGKTFSIGKEFVCGGYNFDFKIIGLKGDEDWGQIDVSVEVDVKNGSVDLIMDDGRTENLETALSNEDYGWEIEGEISDCILDLLTEKITNTTGYEIAILELILD